MKRRRQTASAAAAKSLSEKDAKIKLLEGEIGSAERMIRSQQAHIDEFEAAEQERHTYCGFTL